MSRLTSTPTVVSNAPWIAQILTFFHRLCLRQVVACAADGDGGGITAGEARQHIPYGKAAHRMSRNVQAVPVDVVCFQQVVRQIGDRLQVGRNVKRLHGIVSRPVVDLHPLVVGAALRHDDDGGVPFQLFHRRQTAQKRLEHIELRLVVVSLSPVPVQHREQRIRLGSVVVVGHVQTIAERDFLAVDGGRIGQRLHIFHIIRCDLRRPCICPVKSEKPADQTSYHQNKSNCQYPDPASCRFCFPYHISLRYASCCSGFF